MKHFCTLFFLLTTGWWCTAAQAQNYRPFRFGLSYQLSAQATPGDTTHLLRLAGRQVQGGDSVFLFDKRTSQGRVLPQQDDCGHYIERNDNLFGMSLRLRPGAEYVLAAANGRTFTLRPRALPGQVWAATTAGLTAQVTARTLGSVLGQPDSLVVITLSDGAAITLSRRFGWVSGPALGHYLNARLPGAALTLTALPELNLGTKQLDAFAVYDFQPGDVFLRKAYARGGSQPCVNIWTRDSVLSRAPGRTADTLVYRIRSQSFTQACNRSSQSLAAAQVRVVRITRTTDNLDQPTGFAQYPPGYAQYPPGGAPARLVHLPAARTPDYNRRLVRNQASYLACTIGDSSMLRSGLNIDASYAASVAAGLGQTWVEFNSFSSTTTTLIGYRKGSETWGQLTTFAQLLPVRDSRPASTTAALPNPFGAEIQVAFTLAGPQPVGLTLYDALGRQVQRLAAVPQAAGARHLNMSTAGLPVGVYTLHLHFAGEGRIEVLRVLKTE
ncbi:T9SS type A sorting domain-containing protein [Hymenobacter sp. DH14]|uniref:T9SS type A sorting domain-containing protein n=1 Tax=Hymenobacter cyanobacteriorum TaxID=2926463 RepID=A0A9X2AII7_9BACT|nr:T9SS type A sorting domain-containing protein [Hymenobacter cyanobacteriorum]MCI1188665.1 T9SS type A sorting domain-containing protein [Hymenobacter cyanobacteriorum]